MSYRYPARRSIAEPVGPARLRADEVADCPPHYWVVKDAAQTCRKCGLRLGIGRDGRVVLPERAEEAGGAPVATVSATPADQRALPVETTPDVSAVDIKEG